MSEFIEIEKIDHVGIRVMDVARSLRFYQVLGFQLVHTDTHAPVFVLQHPSGLEVNLVANGEDDYGQRNILMDREPRYPGYTHYAIAVASIPATQAFLAAHRIAITEGPVTFDNGKTSVFIRDPDRNVLEFTASPPAPMSSGWTGADVTPGVAS